MSQNTVIFKQQQHCENLKTHESLLKCQYYLHVNSQTSMAPDSVHAQETSHFMIITKNSNMTVWIFLWAKKNTSEDITITKGTRLKNKMWANPQIKNHKRAMKPDWPDHRQHKKKPEHTYFKFWTPLTPSVEKVVNHCGFKFINQEI